MIPSASSSALRRVLLTVVLLVLAAGSASAKDWWNKEWTIRKKITIDAAAKGSAISDPIGSAVVLVRLHDGNFQFPLAKEDGSDLRFVAEDGKTPLTWHLERFDPLLNEGYAWVRLPEVKPGAATSFWLYYGNPNPTPAGASDAKATYDTDTVLVYHFGGKNAPPADTTTYGHTAQNAGQAVEGALIAGGLRLTGAPPVLVPTAPALAWAEGGAVTWSAWVKLGALQPNALLFSRRDGAKALVVGADQGVPFLEITSEAGRLRTPAGVPFAPNSWHHLAFIAEGGRLTFFVDGVTASTLAGGLPALNGPLAIGGDTADGAVNAQGELDELILSRIALPSGAIRLAALSQGSDKGATILAFAEDEQSGGGGGAHGGYMSVIVGSLTFDGWLVIGILAVMFAISWWVMISKIGYLNAMSKGNAVFMREWRHVATDLTVLDHGNAEKVKSLGGRMDAKSQRALRKSSVYHIYHIGAEEIRHRLAVEQSAKALSSRSIQAIRAALDGGLVREKQRIDKLIVLLTICISGGPFLGLLGTVVGVMITFAAVAAAGDVNVNAIAPGIAAALLATVAGLAVAIPALFGYNYILSRVKDATADMHVFIDEFVTKMAEFYSGTGEEGGQPHPNSASATPSILREILQELRSLRAERDSLLRR